MRAVIFLQVSYIAHQASLENLAVSSLVRDLSETPRNRSSLEVAQALADMLQNEPVHTWQEKIAGNI